MMPLLSLNEIFLTRYANTATSWNASDSLEFRPVDGIFRFLQCYTDLVSSGRQGIFALSGGNSCIEISIKKENMLVSIDGAHINRMLEKFDMDFLKSFDAPSIRVDVFSIYINPM